MRLQAKFALAGSLLALIAVAGGAWSVLTLTRLGDVIDRTLTDNQAAIDLATELAGSLEREDDALLLALSGEAAEGARALDAERLRGDAAFLRLRDRLLLDKAAGASALPEAEQAIVAYRDAGSRLIEGAARSDALEVYHEVVNPLLRRAVAACGTIRERNFASMRQAGVRALGESRSAARVVASASLAALLLAAVVSALLARSIVIPVGRLTESIRAIRLGDFDRRVELTARDELGDLAEGFNRMAETLTAYRQSSLGELLAAKTTLESTLEALPDAVFVIDPGGGLAALNPPARDVLAAVGAAEARSVADLPLGLDQRRAIESALAGRAVHPSRSDFAGAIRVRLDGRPRRLLMTALPVAEFAPRKTGAVVVLDDVTEFALLDELRGELIAVASHELKTPLTTLRMNLLLLSEAAADLSLRHREMVAAALGGCEELGATIDELLDVTRIEAGGLRLELGLINPASLVDSVAEGLRSRFEDAGIRLEVCRDGPPATITADTLRLRAVLTNLLSNALKYSPPGGTVVVQMASRQNAGGQPVSGLQVAVTDQGPGVPDEFRERIFDKFFRVEDQTERTPKGVRGTGIGLYLCREIVRAHGGSIRCDPGDGGIGATFALFLPPRP